jgi:TonB-linked SusC/RagA family outer membrane protein
MLVRSRREVARRIRAGSFPQPEQEVQMHFPRSCRGLGTMAMLLLGLGAVAAPASGQEPYRIQGTVVEAATQQPLPGVQVLIEGTQLGTLTDANGRYTLVARVDPGAYTLRFALIGRAEATRAVTLGADPAVQVTAVELRASAVQLEEIVVTGSGVSAARKAVANTVASVSGEEISEAPGASTIDQALQGKVAGAVISENSGQPGGGVSIRLRGTSSILGGAEPLIVVDGVILDNSNAALVSLGANAGRGSAAMSNRLADLAPGDIASVEILKGAAAAALYGSRANNGVIQIFTKRGQQGEPQITFRTEASVNRAPDHYDLLTYPFASLADVVFAGADSVGAPVERFDVQDQIFRTGAGTTNQLSISGGDEATSYYISGVYSGEDGILESTNYTKKSGRASITQRVSERFNVIANANFINTRTNFTTEGEQTAGVLTAAIFVPTSFDPSFDQDLGRYPYSPLGAAFVNPLDVLANWDFPEQVTRFLGSVEAGWTPRDNLSVRYLFGLDDYRQESKFFHPPGSTSANDVGTISNPVRFSRQINSDITATHEANLAVSSELSSTLGFRYTSDRGEVISSSASDLPPGQQTVGGAVLVTGQSISETHTVGGFLQERLSFNDRLFLTGGLNVEASSAFGADERWQLFPRGGVSWVINEEPFWRDAAIGDLMSSFRVRVAYGETGGQPPGAYSRFNNYGDVAYAGMPGLIPSSLAGNPDLKPERQREYEGGFDAGFFDGRADLMFTYYDQKTYDLVLGVPLPLSSGFSSQLQNIGIITNKGVEVGVNTINFQQPNFSWRSRLTYASNRNRVEKLVTAADSIPAGYLNYVIEGQPIGVFYGRGYQRDANGEIVIDPNTGLGARSPNYQILGDPNPDFTAAFGNTLTFGENIELDVLFDGRFGNDVANFTRRITEFFGSDAIVEEEIRRAQARKTNPDLTPLKYALNGGRIGNYEEYVEDGSFVKLREIALQYTLPTSWVRRFDMESASLRLAGRNLYTWTEYSGLDPEVNLFAGNTVARGVDFAVTPIPRSLSLGATLTF